MKYLEFKGASDAGYFEYYDKEAGINKQYNLNEVEVDNISYTIKGWDDKSNSPIYSGDFTDWKEDITVRTKEGTLYSWPYDKAKIEAVWGKVHIKIIWKQDWDEIAILLKWNNFFNVNQTLKGMNIRDNKLKFAWTEDDKKWAVKFKKTIFEKWGAITREISVEDIPF